jgi:hypothetical protein
MKYLSPQGPNGGVFEVIAYKADPTGATDSQAAFQAAATAAVAYAASNGGATLKINPGKYKLNSAFKVIGGLVTIEAYGAYIFSGVAGNDLFRDYTSQDSSYTLNGSGLTVLGGTWDMKGHTWAQGVEGASAFTLSNSSAIIFRDVVVRNVRAYHGIDLNTCDGVRVKDCRFEGFKNSYEYKSVSSSTATSYVKAASTVSVTVSNPGTAVFDGITLSTGDRVLLKNQSTASQNGIYVFATSGTAMVRSTDMDGGTEADDAAVFVGSGNTQGGQAWIQTTASVTIGTTSQTWTTYYKGQCRVATTANGTFTTAFANGQTVDGVVLATNDRILLKDQASSAQNGIYVVQASGSPVRATDADAAAELNGASVYVTSGTANGAQTYKQTATVVTIGTDPVVWATEYRVNRYFSEAIQIDEGPNGIPCKNVHVDGCYMGPAVDGSGLGSFGKIVGAHTDSPSVLYQNIIITNNKSVGSKSNAIQGYSFQDSIVSNNVIAGSEERGIRFRFDSTNVGPRLAICNNVITDTKFYGIEVDGDPPNIFYDVMVSNNVITSTVMGTSTTVSSPTSCCAIRMDGINRSTVSQNEIYTTSGQQGIFLQTCNDMVCNGNNIIGSSATTQGIQVNGGTNNSVTVNRIFQVGQEGIFLSGSTTENQVSQNYIKGAGRTTDATYDAIRISSASASTGNVIMGNVIRKFGSGNEVADAIDVTGSATGNIIRGNVTNGEPINTTAACMADFETITFFVSGTLASTSEGGLWVAPRDIRIINMRARARSLTTGGTIRPQVNAATNGTTSGTLTTSLASTAQSLTMVAGDFIRLNVVTAGTTCVDVTMQLDYV